MSPPVARVHSVPLSWSEPRSRPRTSVAACVSVTFFFECSKHISSLWAVKEGGTCDRADEPLTEVAASFCGLRACLFVLVCLCACARVCLHTCKWVFLGVHGNCTIRKALVTHFVLFNSYLSATLPHCVLWNASNVSAAPCCVFSPQSFFLLLLRLLTNLGFLCLSVRIYPFCWFADWSPNALYWGWIKMPIWRAVLLLTLQWFFSSWVTSGRCSSVKWTVADRFYDTGTKHALPLTHQTMGGKEARKMSKARQTTKQQCIYILIIFPNYRISQISDLIATKKAQNQYFKWQLRFQHLFPY